MEWLEKFEHFGTDLKPIFVDAAGHRRAGHLRDIRRTNTRSSYRLARIESFNLADFTTCSSDEYLAAVGIPSEFGANQTCFSTLHGGMKMVIPSSILLSALITDLSTIGDRLLRPGSLNQVAQAIAANGSIEMVFGKRLPYESKSHQHKNACRRYEWLSCFPTARKFWASVHHHARLGRMAIDLPKALVDISLTGFRTNGVAYITRARVSKIAPNEAPLEFALGSAHACYQLDRATIAAKKNLQTNRIFRSVDKELTAHISFPAGPHGWGLSPSEWLEVRRNLVQAGYTVWSRFPESLNLAIEKLVQGHSWKSIGPRHRSAEMMARLWIASGRWQVMESTLQKVRTHTT